MKKKLVTTILMLCMAFSLVACGNGTDKDTQKENTENAQQDENKESESVSNFFIDLKKLIRSVE